eukprot:jgi/Bigna1/128756/aug1.7_g3464
MGCIGGRVYLAGGVNGKLEAQTNMYCLEVKPWAQYEKRGELLRTVQLQTPLPSHYMSVGNRNQASRSTAATTTSSNNSNNVNIGAAAAAAAAKGEKKEEGTSSSLGADGGGRRGGAGVEAQLTWYRGKREVHVEVENNSAERHVQVFLQWAKLSNCSIKLVGKGAMPVPPNSKKLYAVIDVPHPTASVDIDFTHVVEESPEGGPSFYMLQPPDDALPKPTVLKIEGGLIASRRRIEIRGVQVEKKPWHVVLKRSGGKYSYLELHIQPGRSRILRRIVAPEVSGEEDEGGCPVLPGQRFVIEILIGAKAYEIRVNRKPFATWVENRI